MPVLYLYATVWPHACQQDSYVLDWFRDMKSFLHVGSPVYFVLDGGYDYEHVASQNKICGLAGCDQDSLVQQVYIASQRPKQYVIQTGP